MQMETSRILGGIGALFMFIGVLPYINYFGIVEIIGIILVMIALSGFAGYFKEGGIFNNALYGLIIAIVGAVISVVTIIVVVLSSLTDFLKKIFPGWNGTDWRALAGMTPNTSNITLSSIAPFIEGIIAVFVILWVFAIISAFFVRRSLGTLTAKSGVGLFSTAGLILLIGAVLIIVGIGLILVWISALLIAIAFFEVKPQQTQPTTQSAAA
jgi:uncharacterized membrane protein